MSNGLQVDEKTKQAMLEQAQEQLAPVFQNVNYDVSLFLFTSPGKNDLFSEGARQMIRAIREMTPKIDLREYDLNHELAQKWNVEHAPTILFDPERYNIRWLGAPMGEEGRCFVEALIMMGYRETNLNQESMKVLQKIQSPRDVKIFVSHSCPY